MKPLNKEQQEQAIEIIEKVSNEAPQGAYRYYVEKAQAFLNSLKPKIYICKISGCYLSYYLEHIDGFTWNNDISIAKPFNSIEEAREVLDSIQKDENYKYFIITE